MQHYVVIVEDNIFPRLEGPYDLEEERDLAAKHHHQRYRSHNNLFALDIDHEGDPAIWPFSARLLQNEEEE